MISNKFYVIRTSPGHYLHHAEPALDNAASYSANKGIDGAAVFTEQQAVAALQTALLYHSRQANCWEIVDLDILSTRPHAAPSLTMAKEGHQLCA